MPSSHRRSLQPPRIVPEDRDKLREYWKLYEREAGSIQAEIERALDAFPSWSAILAAMSPAARKESQERSLSNQRTAIVSDDWKPYLDELQSQGALYAKNGLPFSDWFQVLTVYRAAVRRRVLELEKTDPARAARVSDGLDLLVDIAMASIGESYLEAKEEIIRDQQEAIREISTPVLQVSDRVLILPVVGLVDSYRARVLTEGLLRAVSQRRAKAVVMDITGVPIVDSKVANHLAQACEAARLMGVVVVLTGISPDIAQTLVTIGAQLRGVRTVGDLQGGIEEVERLLARHVLDDEEAEVRPKAAK